MSRMKALFAALVLTAAISALAPSASATAKGVVIASGSSALWQTMALAAYNSGQCPVPKKGLSCSHYTDNTKFNLVDSRPGKKQKGAASAVDAGDIWIVWDNTSGPNVWAYLKTDSVVGNRCFFANPVCTVQAPSTTYNWSSAGQKISANLWGADSTSVPTTVQTLFANGTGAKINTAASDIRPEDAQFAICRVNSQAGSNAFGADGDATDGLGYNSNNKPGICAEYSKTGTLADVQGSQIISGYYNTTAASAPFNVLAFNISGKDPFTDATVAAYDVISAGATPVTFIYSRAGASGTGLNQGTGASGLSASADQLQNLFSGSDCDASTVFTGVTGVSTPIDAYLREPLSGTMNTTEATVFRRPVQTISSDGTTKQGDGSGSASLSQETGVAVGGVPTNPLKDTACTGGVGFRSRAIGTSEEVNSVLNSQSNNGLDGVGYTFFSFGNVGAIAGKAAYGYIKLDGVDPLGLDAAAQTTYPNQELPACTAPCTETDYWSAVGKSFPNLRNGTYGAWSLLRMVTTTANKTNVQNLVDGSQAYAVNTTPDYVPGEAVPVGCTTSCTDSGLQVFRAHYQQLDGAGNNLGPAATLGTFNSTNNPKSGDTGGDMGGCVGTISGGGTTFTITETNGTQLTGAATDGVIQIGIDTDVNSTTGSAPVSCSNGPDRN
jgi:hypothetical protein